MELVMNLNNFQTVNVSSLLYDTSLSHCVGAFAFPPTSVNRVTRHTKPKILKKEKRKEKSLEQP